MASPWDQLFVVAKNNEEAKKEAERKSEPLPEKICPSCKQRPCAIIKTTHIHAAYCDVCHRIKNRKYQKKCDHKKPSANTST